MFRIFFVVLLLVVSSCTKQEKPLSKKAIVPIPPYAFIVERLTQNAIKPKELAANDASMHSYEPTQKQVLELAVADVWITLKGPVEQHIQKAMLEQNPHMTLIDITKNIDPLYDHNELDPHIWLSPREMQKQVQIITDGLIKKYPELKEPITTESEKLIQELKDLDLEVRKSLSRVYPRVLFVNHPAFSYFCRDYNLEQIGIEEHGKDISQKRLARLLERIERKGVKTVFIQAQYPSKAANVIAEKLHLKIAVLDPMQRDYFENIRSIAHTIQKELENS